MPRRWLGTRRPHERRKEITMGAGDKVKHGVDDLAGKAKEAAGKLTDDEKTEAEGKADQSRADLKKAGDKVKDAFER
jgi:uncharacterized protein YjbJ (UPF0337 family)